MTRSVAAGGVSRCTMAVWRLCTDCVRVRANKNAPDGGGSGGALVWRQAEFTEGERFCQDGYRLGLRLLGRMPSAYKGKGPHHGPAGRAPERRKAATPPSPSAHAWTSTKRRRAR